MLSRLSRSIVSTKFGSRNSSSLKAVLAGQMDAKRAQLVDMKKKYGHVSLGEVTVDQAIGGARGVKCMLWETSLLDADEGMYSKRRRSNVAVIIVRVIVISLFLFYWLLLNHSFPTNPNRITNCFKLFSLYLQLTTTLLLRRYFDF